MQMYLSQPGNTDGFDEYAGKRWIYPNNMAVRGYQRQAVEKALFNNAMIVLPTGFGKTFIAAVVMYNFYRWYPRGKIIFVAPTRPLVTQQIQECKKISGIPTSDCVELTGQLSRGKRSVFWQSKRVFFATPQVIENDLEQDEVPAREIKCIVIDEAHRAQGSYAYVNIIRKLQEDNKDGFRVLALSATPGSDIQRVQQVMQNLFISDVMFRSENSIDLMQFKNEKCSRAWTCDLVGKHREFLDRYIKLCDPVFKELYRAGLTYSGDSVDKVAKYTLVTAARRIRQNDFCSRGSSKGRLLYISSAACSLCHNFDLLALYGIRVFYSSVTRNLREPRSALKTLTAGSVELEKLLGDIRHMFGEDVEPEPTKEPKCDLLKGHPKLSVVKDILMKHFEENKDKGETRAMIFTKYRESVFDIVQALKAFEPILKPACFVGQNSTSKTGAGMKQREQIQLVSDFKAGKYNVIVATSVAEEGLDIGEVDLIICYDTSGSPISTTQRRGRTGRKRSGAVQTLLTKGYEEKKLKNASNSRRQVEDQLFKRENYMTVRYKNAPRMIPNGIVPVCLEQKLYPVNDEPEDEPKPKRAKRANKDASRLDDSIDEIKKSKGKASKCNDESFASANDSTLVEDSDDELKWSSDEDDLMFVKCVAETESRIKSEQTTTADNGGDDKSATPSTSLRGSQAVSQPSICLASDLMEATSPSPQQQQQQPTHQSQQPESQRIVIDASSRDSSSSAFSEAT